MNTDQIELRHQELFKTLRQARDMYGVPCLEVLELAQSIYGRSAFREAIDKLNRRRIENITGRPERIKHKWSFYKRLYNKQKGICPWCQSEMALIKGKVEIDHVDPNAGDDFNKDKNLVLTHSACNRSKSSKSLEDFALEQGDTVAGIISRTHIEPDPNEI